MKVAATDRPTRARTAAKKTPKKAAHPGSRAGASEAGLKPADKIPATGRSSQTPAPRPDAPKAPAASSKAKAHPRATAQANSEANSEANPEATAQAKTGPKAKASSRPAVAPPAVAPPAVGASAKTASASALAPQADSRAAPPRPAPPERPEAGARPPLPDFDRLATNLGALVEEAGKALAAVVRPRETGEIKSEMSDEVVDAARAIGKVTEFWLSDPQRALQAQTSIATRFLDLWGMTLKRMSGEEAAPVAPPAPGDKRFSAPEWGKHPLFDFLRQAYVLTATWADDLAARADSLDPHVQAKARFYIRQLTSALSPSNFVPTNPELIAETLKENGENLVRGMRMMAQDIAAGHGSLKIRQSDSSKFEMGVNLASTPGKVIFRNDLIELLQYAPTTETVYKRPLLIVPPWINKFYILDLNPEKSFIRWAVAQGFTVFTISWVNPDERHADKDFESYMREGVFAALEAIEQATGERKVSAIGYCVGGTLLASSLAYMAQTKDERIESTTFFTTQVDFTDPGELKVFVDEEQIRAVEQKMAEHGYLEGSKMASAFNMLRPNDLIWSYYVNNYLKGKEPMPFDLLTWNSDSTRMPRANHSFYLRNCYLENNLSHGRMELGGLTLDLSKVTMPIYNLAAREDHIAPAKSVFVGSQYFGGPVRYVMAGSGHIAGVVNPPMKPKYQYWLGDAPKGAFEDWVARAKEHPGSWWPDWAAWMQGQSPAKVAARQPGGGKLKPLGDAPGEYVKVRV